MSRIFKVFYIVFILVCVLYPFRAIVAPITYRHILSLVMLGFCLFLKFKTAPCPSLVGRGGNTFAIGYYLFSFLGR